MDKLQNGINAIEKILQDIDEEEAYKNKIKVIEKNKKSLINNYHQSINIFKVAKDFSINYNSIVIPKGGMYGKLGRLRIMVTNYKQFSTVLYPNKTKFTINLMDLDDNDFRGFRKITIKKHSHIYNLIYAYIEYNKLYGQKIEYQLMLKKGDGRPKDKKPQTDYDFNIGKIGYALSGKTSTEYSVTDKVRRYVSYN